MALTAGAGRDGVVNRIADLPRWLASAMAANATLFGGLVFALFFAGVTLISIVYPQPNWDLIAYTAAIAEPRFHDAAGLHAHAYESVRQMVDAAQFAALTSSDAYRAHQFANPDAFVSMLGMYKVKALYIQLAAALAPTFGEIGAMRLISTVSTAATGLVFLLWLYRRNAFAFAPAVIGILLISGYADAARLGSPDAFFMALLSFGLYLYDRQKLWLAGLALFLATLVRSDTVVFLAAWSVLILVFRVKAWPIIAAFAASLIAYPLVTHSANHPGFWAHFVFSTTEQKLTMEGFHPAFSVAVYVRALAIGLVRTISETAWPAAIGMLLPVWVWLRSRTALLGSREDALIIALVAGVIGRFILFPLPDTRIHGAYLTPLLMLLLPAAIAWSSGFRTVSKAV